MIQVVERLLCKHGALNSNPDPTKKNQTGNLGKKTAYADYFRVLRV
jgi:hypothetical protein